MQFDVFHSLGRIDDAAERRTDRQVFAQFFAEVAAADRLGYGTIWVAESHFSSEVQKHGPAPVIPHYRGEVGLNCDSLQLGQLILERTKRLGFGTAIMNIVGGNGGPIAAADRVRTLAWLNSLRDQPRNLSIGVASGRFPYINRPFGIVPRTQSEKGRWPETQALIFIEALTIFLRLLNGDTLGSEDLDLGDLHYADATPYTRRWEFERLKLVPEMSPAEWTRCLRIVLGSASPQALETGFTWADVDVFNLSFTPPAAIEKLHVDLASRCVAPRLPWHRSRLPRTVMVFIDRDRDVAEARASACFDTYIEAMRGTAQVPDKGVLMQRALIGTAADIRAQLAPGARHGFHPDDRLMLWFEFNQTNGSQILDQMERFADQVLPYVTV
ncbi:MAG: LLM class flavin-dependent oxidoreductase [Proteobacteria bacterium]|nr:LLM class flavin-dependent oxidoreductase [Pseudomonadota bacterium]